MVKLLLDQDVYAVTARFLVDAGYDVITASQLNLSRASDEEILKTAQAQNRILITRDRDYGHLVFVRKIEISLIYLRVSFTSINAVHNELIRVLQTYSEAELFNAFIVIAQTGHKLRKLS